MATLCTSCEAFVLWVSLEPRLQAHPLDAKPTLKGNIRVTGTRRATARVLKKPELAEARVLKKPELAEARERGELLYTSHFATCPNAAEHRKKSAPSSGVEPKATPPKPSRPKTTLPCVATASDEGADTTLAGTVRP